MHPSVKRRFTFFAPVLTILYRKIHHTTIMGHGNIGQGGMVLCPAHGILAMTGYGSVFRAGTVLCLAHVYSIGHRVFSVLPGLCDAR